VTGEEKALKEALEELHARGFRVREEDVEADRYDEDLVVTYPDAYWGESNEDARVEVKIKEVRS
jgi:hypothetical protein